MHPRVLVIGWFRPAPWGWSVAADMPPSAPDEMASLAAEICSCRRCGLCESRTMTVPGEGPVPCRVMLIGEGPGKKEDESGRPFVGRAGAILTGLLAGIGLSRDEVYITSVVKCRPPENRSPKKEEIASCIPFLERQIMLLSPAVLVPMGRIASSAVFSRFDLPHPSFREVRGRVYRVSLSKDIPDCLVIPVYHPAVITHNPPARTALEQDFRRLGDILQTSRDAP